MIDKTENTSEKQYRVNRIRTFWRGGGGEGGERICQIFKVWGGGEWRIVESKHRDSEGIVLK